MRSLTCLLVALVATATLAPAPADAYPPQANQQAIQQLQRRMQDYYRQQQEQQRRYMQAVQQRNQQLVKQYQDAMKKRQDQYAAEVKKLKDSGVTPQQLVAMQREAILAQVPRSQQSALKRKWAREDRIRKLAIDRARRTGKPIPAGADNGGLDLGGLEDLKLD